MTDMAEGHTSGAEGSETESAPAASAAPVSPMPAPSESSSAGGSASSSMEGRSGLLQKIKDLQDTQKALKEQKKEVRPGAEERIEATEKVAGQGVSAQRLRLGGGSTYAQGQEGECPDSGEYATTRSLSARPIERGIDGQDAVSCVRTYGPRGNQWIAIHHGRIHVRSLRAFFVHCRASHKNETADTPWPQRSDSILA